MKLTVGRKSVIARNINNVFWSIISLCIGGAFLLYVTHLNNTHDSTFIGLFDDYKLENEEIPLVVFGTTISVIFLFVFLVQICEAFIGVHYFKKTETNIDTNKIIQSTYGFPYSKDLKSITVDDISKVNINQSTIQRIFGCGDIAIKGYSNSNYSKTDFKVYIEGIDDV